MPFLLFLSARVFQIFCAGVGPPEWTQDCFGEGGVMIERTSGPRGGWRDRSRNLPGT